MGFGAQRPELQSLDPPGLPPLPLGVWGAGSPSEPPLENRDNGGNFLLTPR